MKPRVFLSHAKEDREFIKGLSTSLRSGRIDVWYDDWEIPPGASLRQYIFEEGIPNSELFFVYLTPSSAESFWVKRELDAAFVKEVENRGGFLAVFVDRDETRTLLPSDLRALRCPVLNQEVYWPPILELTASAWHALLRAQVAKAHLDARFHVLERETTISSLELTISRLSASGAIDKDVIIKSLGGIGFKLGEKAFALIDLFRPSMNLFAVGTTLAAIDTLVADLAGLPQEPFGNRIHFHSSTRVSELVGPLVIWGIVSVVPETDETAAHYYLTPLGSEVAARLG